MKNRFYLFGSILLLAGYQLQVSFAGEPPPPVPMPLPKDLDTPRSFPAIQSRQEWQARAARIREQILVSCGLWPLPEKTPLQPHIFGRIEHDGYSVEKVCLRTCPGFYLAGNLYRPLGRGKGPFPGVLNPHGHWDHGRLEDSEIGSIRARCISFARQGMVAFCYDMVGYNDTRFADSAGESFSQAHHRFGTNRADLLWNISLMGLQTWNSIRALDFLAALPDVDPKRLACTGASGGGTQTFMLGAIDDRLAAQAPIVMVSHTMQGGCLCENAPGLRVEYSNMELAAAAAPRPQILVAATGDWTKATLAVEGPAIARIYELFRAADRFRYLRFDFGHNYNQTTREAVYAWFGRWLLRQPDAPSVPETPYPKDADADLRVFPDGKLPPGALTQAGLIASLRQQHEAQWQALVPKSKSGLEKFKKVMQPAWEHTLLTDWPIRAAQAETESLDSAGSIKTALVKISRPGGRVIRATCFAPAAPKDQASQLVVLCSDDASLAFASELARKLVGHGIAVLEIKQFGADAAADPFANFYSTYNRTRLQERVGDLMAVCAAGRSMEGPRRAERVRVVLCGVGQAGLWALLAAPAADAVIADGCRLDVVNDEVLLAPDLFCPGIRNIGTFEGGAMLAAPHPLLLHNTGDRFPTEGLRAAYKAAGAVKKLQIQPERVSEDDLLKWMR